MYNVPVRMDADGGEKRGSALGAQRDLGARR